MLIDLILFVVPRWEFHFARRLNMKPWSKEEDELLMTLREENGDIYHISRKLPGRTIEAIRARCDELGLGLLKKLWSEEDINTLKLAVEEFTIKGRIHWRKVSERLPGRSARSVMCKYNGLVKRRQKKSTPPSSSD